MKAEHTTTVHGRCPINGNWDYYELTVVTDSFVQCETIDCICNEARGEPWTQEQMAKHFRAQLPRHCSFTLEGRHGQNVGLKVSG